MRASDLILLLLLVVGVSVIAGLLLLPAQEIYSVSPEGVLSYSNRPASSFEFLALNESTGVARIRIPSHGGSAYGLLSFPSGAGPFPAFIVLPGAGVLKEGEQLGLSADLNSLGFATLTLDLRGQGEGAAFLPLEEDFQRFASGQEATFHQQVYDILRAHDFLRRDSRILPGKIYVAGESAGGRFAIVAAGTESGIAGVLGVSTAGFPVQTDDPKILQYLTSINPAAAISRVNGPVLLLHSSNDSIIPLADAEATLANAKEPKKLIVFEKPGHGYDPLEKIYLEQELPAWR